MKRPGSLHDANLVRWLLAWAAAGLGVLRAQTAEPEMVVELPQFEITEKLDLPPRESWRYAQWGDFELLSNADDATTQEFVCEYLRWMKALRAVYSLVGWKPTGPITLILCRDQVSFATFGRDRVTEAPWRNIAQRLGAGADRTLAVYKYAQGQSGGPLNGDLFSMEIPVTRSDYEGIRISYMLRVDAWRMDPQPPAWLVKALSVLVVSMTISGDSVVLGAPSEVLDYRSYFLRPTPISLQSLFSVESPIVGGRVESRHVTRIHNEISMAWDDFYNTRLLFRRCMLSGDAQYREGYLKLVARATVGPVTEEVFKECFGKNYKEMDRELRSLRDGMKWGVAKIKDFKFEAPEITLREATDAEVGRIKGEALAQMDDPEMSAYVMLVAPYVRKASDPRLLAALGLYHRTNGNDRRAREFLEAAVAAGVDRSLAYLELGSLRYEEAIKSPAGAGGKLSAEQAFPVLEPLLKARLLKWASPKIYDRLAEVWTRSEIPPTRENLAVLVEGIRASPLRAELVCRTVAFCAQAGFAPEARAWADYGLKTFPDPAVRSRLEQALAMPITSWAIEAKD